MTQASARQRAASLINDAGVTKAPVPVDKLARSLNVRIKYAPLDGDISGMAYIAEGISVIGVNALHPPTRQRFTLAHELGHVVLHEDFLRRGVHLDHGVLKRDALASQGTDRREMEANAFASELLMPETFLNTALGGRSVDIEDDDAIDALARRFRVSSAAMRFRLMFLSAES